MPSGRRPCPFCGWEYSDVKRQQHYGEWLWVQCSRCSARGPRVQSKEDAVQGWDQAERGLPLQPEEMLR